MIDDEHQKKELKFDYNRHKTASLQMYTFYFVIFIHFQLNCLPILFAKFSKSKNQTKWIGKISRITIITQNEKENKSRLNFQRYKNSKLLILLSIWWFKQITNGYNILAHLTHNHIKWSTMTKHKHIDLIYALYNGYKVLFKVD